MDVNQFAARAEAVKGQLYRTALLYVNSESIALDAVDEAIYRGFKGLKSLREPAYFETWITRILINECKKELRKRKREKLVEVLPETATEAFDALPLKDAIYRLPTELKDVIILRYFAGLTLAQTAQSLAIPQGTVVTRQRRAIGLLRLELVQGGITDESE